MLDPISIKSMSDGQLQDAIQSIERKLMGVSPSNTSGTLDLMLFLKETIMNEISERQMIEQFKANNKSQWNLTVDPLSEYEDKAKEQKD